MRLPLNSGGLLLVLLMIASIAYEAIRDHDTAAMMRCVALLGGVCLVFEGSNTVAVRVLEAVDGLLTPVALVMAWRDVKSSGNARG